MAKAVGFELEKTITLRDGRAIRLRNARPQDAADLLEIDQQISEEGISTVTDEVETLEERTEKLTKMGVERMWLVAEHEGRVVGALVLHRAHPVFLRHHLFLGISIHRDFRGAGLGSDMMRHAAAWAKHEGYEFIRLGVLDSNPRAKQLYEKLGYRTYGHLPRFVKLRDGTYVGDTQMWLEL